MNRLNCHVSPNMEADLQRLVEPLASYIAAIGQPKVALIASLILLLDSLREINAVANQHLASYSENHFG
jgi:hypothetical protein